MAGKKQELPVIKWPRNQMLNIVATFYQHYGNVLTTSDSDIVTTSETDIATLLHSRWASWESTSKNTPKERWFFIQRNMVEKSTWKWRWYFAHWSYAKQSTWKGRQFSLIETTSKKYVEIMWKLIDVFFSARRPNTDIKLTFIQRGVSVA